MRWNQSAPCGERDLQGFRKFFRQYLRLFRQIPGANPVAHASSGAGLGNETPDFGSKISLRGVQVSSPRCCQVSLRDADALACLLLRGRPFFGCQLGHDNRRFWLIGAIVVGRRVRRTSRPRRATVCRRDRRRRRRNQDAEFWHGICRRIIGGWRRGYQFRPRLNRCVPSERRLSSHGAASSREKGGAAHHRQGNPRAGAEWNRGGTLRPGWFLRHAQAASGSSMRNVVPRPTSDVKSIEPL